MYFLSTKQSTSELFITFSNMGNMPWNCLPRRLLDFHSGPGVQRNSISAILQFTPALLHHFIRSLTDLMAHLAWFAEWLQPLENVRLIPMSLQNMPNSLEMKFQPQLDLMGWHAY